MFPFSAGKKKEAKKVYIPVDLVLRYSAQGLSEPDIISRLEAQGFSSENIDKSLRIALRERVVSGAPPSPMEMTEEAPEAPSPEPFDTGETFVGPVPIGEVTRRPMPMGYPPERIVQQSMEQAMPQQIIEQPEVQRSDSHPTTEITVEEIIEAIVAERWRDFEDKLKVFEQKNMQLHNEIDEIRKKVDSYSGVLDEKEKTIASKIDEFGESVIGIEGRIGSIERVFKDFLPELSTNIRTMSDLVEKIKKEK